MSQLLGGPGKGWTGVVANVQPLYILARQAEQTECADPENLVRDLT